VADPAMTASGQVVVPESESPHGVVAASTSYSDPGSSALSTSQLGDQEPEASEQSLRAAVAAATSPQLVALFLYPIKSCAPQQVRRHGYLPSQHDLLMMPGISDTEMS
jgi:hypothetical protein